MGNWQKPLIYKEKKAIVNDFNGTGVRHAAYIDGLVLIGNATRRVPT